METFCQWRSFVGQFRLRRDDLFSVILCAGDSRRVSVGVRKNTCDCENGLVNVGDELHRRTEADSVSQNQVSATAGDIYTSFRTEQAGLLTFA